MELYQLVDDLNIYLNIADITDYCPNGLQVAGRPEIKKIVTGVTASLALLEAAQAADADCVLVHHGYFWKGDSPCLVGPMYERIRTLIQNNISLIAYHLPLDLHPEVGNNYCFGELLDIAHTSTFAIGGVAGLGWIGELSSPVSAEQLNERLSDLCARTPLHISGSERPLQRIAWCTGAAQDGITEAALAGADAFISGEISERTVHLARELGIHYFAAGHHATERYGIQALGAMIAEKYPVCVEFIDIDNPV